MGSLHRLHAPGGTGLRLVTEHEQANHEQHLSALENLGGEAMELAASLLKESKQEGCHDPGRLMDLSERMSVIAADLHRAYEDAESTEPETRM